MSYAESTTVSPEKSQLEIAGLLRKYGATGFLHGWQEDRAMVSFDAHGRRVRFDMTTPTDWAAYRFTKTRVRRSDAAAKNAMEAEVRRRWRALLLVIKAKLEAVETGIVSFEEEFAAHIVLPDGTTVAQHVIPAIQRAYETGVIEPMIVLPVGPALPALTAGGAS